MQWSPQQEAALETIRKWLADKNAPQSFYMAGYAGTGKTTMAKEIAEECNGRVLFGAYIGKAAQVLQSKGCPNAMTIHSMIYRIVNDHPDNPVFELNADSEANDVKLIIIDECSMVDEKIGNDLLSFNKKVLVLGDPAQLPPIDGTGFFTGGEPDILLTEIHRQAKDNPIIAMSMKVRAGERLTQGEYGDSKIVSVTAVTDKLLGNADQLIVGTNAKRQEMNNRFRRFLGFTGDNPMIGEKIICLRNDYRVDIFNGTMWIVDKIEPDTEVKNLLRMEVHSVDNPEIVKKIKIFNEYFRGLEKTLTPDQRKQTQQFTYGYAITCHKSQGSQWDNVLIWDESMKFRESAMFWLYTAITRAAKTVTVIT